MSHCIVSVGVGQWYHRGVARLERSLIHHGWGGDQRLWMGSYPDGCPSHKENPYAFKLAAIEEARNRGHDTILWIDASGWAIANPLPILQQIEVQGHYFWTSGFNVAQWTNDRTLNFHGATREKARQWTMIYACVIGLDFRHPRTVDFFEKWKEAMKAGVFRGSWKREEGDTEHEEFQGHRHDQSSASIIANQLGMGIDMTCDTCRTYERTPPESVKLFFQGM